jgi:hypothetical protein
MTTPELIQWLRDNSSGVYRQVFEQLQRERDEARAESIRWMSIAEGRGRTDDEEENDTQSELAAWELLTEATRERDALRDIFPRILIALQSGNCAADCSVDFLQMIPKEVELVRQSLERELAAVTAQRDEAREKAAAMVMAGDYYDLFVGKVQEDLTAMIKQRDEARAEMIRWMSIAEGRGRTDDDERLAAVTAQRDRLAEALKEIEWSNGSQWQADRAKAALQSLNQND